MTGKNVANHEEGTSGAAESVDGLQVTLSFNQPVLFIDGAILKPANNMVELLLIKAESTGSAADHQSTNICHGRYIMSLEAFDRLTNLFVQYHEKLHQDVGQTE